MKRFNKVIVCLLFVLLALPFPYAQAFAEEMHSSDGREAAIDGSGQGVAVGEADLATFEETQDQNREPSKMNQENAKIVNEGVVPDFVYIDLQKVSLGEALNIAVSLPEGTQLSEKASLQIVNAAMEEALVLESTLVVDNSVLFSFEFNDDKDIADYQVAVLEYTLLGDEKLYHSDLAYEGEYLQFSVVSEKIVRNASLEDEVSLDIYTFDEEGGLVAADSIEEAIEEAVESSVEPAAGITSLSTPVEPLAGKVIVALDPGHGGTDPGASGNGLVEKHLNLKIAQACRDELLNYNGVEVFMTRTGDYAVPLEDRAVLARNAGASLFVSIHINSSTSGSPKGAEIWIPNNSNFNSQNRVEGKALAEKILKEIASLGIDTSRGLKQGDNDTYKYPDGSWADMFRVLRDCRSFGITAVLVEHGFISNASDAAFLSNDANLKKLGVADATAIASHLGLVKWSWNAKVTATVSANQKTAKITVDGAGAPSGLTSVQVPTWGSSGGQNDLAWYPATKENGNWVVTVPIDKHKETGTYYAHVYAATKGASQMVGSTTFKIDSFTPTITITNKTNGSFEVAVSATPAAGIQGVTVPVWSSKGGQDDLVWYTAAKQDDGTYKITVNPANHKSDEGTYNIHAYVTAGNGIVAAAASTTTVKLPAVTVTAAVSSDQKKVTLTASGGTIGSASVVYFPTWGATGGQNDIVWYKGTKEGGNWVAVVPIASHKEAGTYNTHVYATVNGIQKAVGATTFKIDAPTASISVSGINESAGTFNVVIDGISAPSGVSRVQVPLWSASNQSDIIWYNATKISNTQWQVTVNVRDHKFNTGSAIKYTAHVYLTTGTGITAFVGSTSASLKYTGSAGYAIMGLSNCTVNQMVARYKQMQQANPSIVYPSSVYSKYGASNIEAFCAILYEEALAEGVRAEVVFAQAMHETGWLKFGGDVKADQCNFAGIGATGGGNPGNSFNTNGSNSVRIGLRAQVQHLKAYASKDALNNTCVDPRFTLVTRGCAVNVEDLSGKWAVGSTYGTSLVNQIKELMKM